MHGRLTGEGGCVLKAFHFLYWEQVEEKNKDLAWPQWKFYVPVLLRAQLILMTTKSKLLQYAVKELLFRYFDNLK